MIELTEHVPVEDYAAVRLALADLRRAGARAAAGGAGQDSHGDGALIPNAGGKGIPAPNRPPHREARGE